MEYVKLAVVAMAAFILGMFALPFYYGCADYFEETVVEWWCNRKRG